MTLMNWTLVWWSQAVRKGLGDHSTVGFTPSQLNFLFANLPSYNFLALSGIFSCYNSILLVAIALLKYFLVTLDFWFFALNPLLWSPDYLLLTRFVV